MFLLHKGPGYTIFYCVASEHLAKFKKLLKHFYLVLFDWSRFIKKIRTWDIQKTTYRKLLLFYHLSFIFPSHINVNERIPWGNSFIYFVSKCFCPIENDNGANGNKHKVKKPFHPIRMANIMERLGTTVQLSKIIYYHSPHQYDKDNGANRNHPLKPLEKSSTLILSHNLGNSILVILF